MGRQLVYECDIPYNPKVTLFNLTNRTTYPYLCASSVTTEYSNEMHTMHIRRAIEGSTISKLQYKFYNSRGNQTTYTDTIGTGKYFLATATSDGYDLMFYFTQDSYKYQHHLYDGINLPISTIDTSSYKVTCKAVPEDKNNSTTWFRSRVATTFNSYNVSETPANITDGALWVYETKDGVEYHTQVYVLLAPEINIHYKVYAESDYNDYEHIGLIKRVIVEQDPIAGEFAVETRQEIDGSFYWRYGEGWFNFRPQHTPAYTQVTYDNLEDFAIQALSLDYSFTDLTGNTTLSLYVRDDYKIKNVPVNLFNSPPTIYNNDFTLVRADSLNSTPSPTGRYVWIVPGIQSVNSYEYLSYTVKVNGTAITPTQGNIYRFTPQPEQYYSISVTTHYSYYGHVIRDDTVTKSYSTTTASMYFDNAGDFGINSIPDEDSVTCSVLNIYQPGYKDNYEYALFCMREASDSLTDVCRHHTLLFKENAPVTEQGSRVTVSGQFTLIQWLPHMQSQCMSAHLHPPTIMCQYNGGILWNIPATADWHCEAYPMVNEVHGTEVACTFRLEWTVTTSVTIDTDVQLNNECAYVVTYWDPNDWYIDNVKYTTTGSGKTTQVTESYSEHNLNYVTVVEGYNGLPVETYEPGFGNKERPITAAAYNKDAASAGSVSFYTHTPYQYH